MKRVVLAVLAALVLVTGLLAGAGEAAAAGRGPGPGTGPVAVSGSGVPLTPEEIAGLRSALDSEYESWATYDQVISDFGRVFPFATILRSETTHINALKNLFRRYGIEIPANPWVGLVPHYATVQAACAASAELELEQGPLYDALIAGTTHPDLQRVYTNLKSASINRHLPAFQRCAAP